MCKEPLLRTHDASHQSFSQKIRGQMVRVATGTSCSGTQRSSGMESLFAGWIKEIARQHDGSESLFLFYIHYLCTITKGHEHSGWSSAAPAVDSMACTRLPLETWKHFLSFYHPSNLVCLSCSCTYVATPFGSSEVDLSNLSSSLAREAITIRIYEVANEWSRKCDFSVISFFSSCCGQRLS